MIVDWQAQNQRSGRGQAPLVYGSPSKHGAFCSLQNNADKPQLRRFRSSVKPHKETPIEVSQNITSETTDQFDLETCGCYLKQCETNSATTKAGKHPTQFQTQIVEVKRFVVSGFERSQTYLDQTSVHRSSD